MIESAEQSQRSRFPVPPVGHKDWYVYEAVRSIPRIVLMVDKNRFSSTYGCFDREYWHYRTVDFACAMNQEFCLPLALVYNLDHPGNPYYANGRLRELAIAGIHFARKTTHADGSCDDYFPFEKALGASVFSTYAMTESFLALGLDDPELVDFFRLRGDWLAANNESGQLANHQAFAALALYNVYTISGDKKYLRASDEFRDITLSWQHEEGWFQEYEGADPGYHSCSIAFLAKLWRKSGDDSLIEPLRRAVEFATYFMHPDGSYGGEYGSRNTYHFYPHGFEVCAEFAPIAGAIAETYLQRSLPERRRYFNDDNRMCSHYVYDWLQAWADYYEGPRELLEARRGPFERHFPGAGLLVKKTPAYYAVASFAKGGVVKVFTSEGPLYSDTGVMLRTSSGETLVPHLVDPDHEVAYQPGTATVAGCLSVRRQPLASPIKQILFRLLNLSVGRYSPHLLRRVLQKILITGKLQTAARFQRRIRLDESRIVIEDSISLEGFRGEVVDVAVASDATSIYVANSNTFQESTLLPWQDLEEAVTKLNTSRAVTLPERTVAVDGAEST